MAQRIEVILVDDLDGSEADETIQFSIDGNHYEIDLTSANAKEFRAAFRRYIRKGRPMRATQQKNEAAEIRKWATENGYEVNERGRLRKEIIDAYREAQQA
ncbi:histone-like nucleoid-structuring protein Lsr2 [Micrococcoides hystricis]|uniref:Lsr2 family protein n=1 Tax=Micrococcoides hystricis TaxID=1572761 RepID=A0ABV6PB55_9MICC